MRRVASACACLLATSCARDNPEFGLAGDAAGGKGTTTSETTGGNDDPTAVPDDDDNDPTALPDDDDDDDDDDDAIDTGGSDASSEESNGSGDCMPFDLPLPSFNDTFVVYDAGELCAAGACETSNFGASPEWPVLDTNGTYRAYLIARFQMPDGVVELDSAELDLHVAMDLGDDVPAFGVAVYTLGDTDWGEGNGTESVATLGESSWVDSAVPTGWTAILGTFPNALGEGLGTASFPITPSGAIVTIPLTPGEVQAEILPDGFFNLAVTVSEGQPTAFWTREALEEAIVLRVSGCTM